jgi:glycyl-tRNA synthetase
VDYDTLEDDTVTVRDRDSTEQRRVAVDDLVATLAGLRAGDLAFEDV